MPPPKPGFSSKLDPIVRDPGAFEDGLTPEERAVIAALAGEEDEDRAPTRATLRGPDGLTHSYGYNPATRQYDIDYGITSAVPRESAGRTAPAGLASRDELLADGFKDIGFGQMEKVLADGRVQGAYRDIDFPQGWRTSKPERPAGGAGSRLLTLPTKQSPVQYETDVLGAERPGAIAGAQVEAENFVRFQMGQVGQGTYGNYTTDAKIAGDIAMLRHENNIAMLKASGQELSTNPDPLKRAVDDAVAVFKMQEQRQELLNLGNTPAEAADRLRGGPPGISEVEATRYAFRPPARFKGFLDRTSRSEERTSDYLAARGLESHARTNGDEANAIIERRNELNAAAEFRHGGEVEVRGYADGGSVSVVIQPAGGPARRRSFSLSGEGPLDEEESLALSVLRAKMLQDPRGRGVGLTPEEVALLSSFETRFRGGSGAGDSGAEVGFAIQQAAERDARARESRARQVGGLEPQTPVDLPLGAARNPPRLGSRFYASFPDVGSMITNLQIQRAAEEDPIRANQISNAIGTIRGMLPSSGIDLGGGGRREYDHDDEGDRYRGPTQFAGGGAMMANEEIVGIGRFTHRPYFRLAEGMPFAGQPEKLTITPLKEDVTMGRERMPALGRMRR